ncbi:DUF4214 domain-containing protein [Stutzerimonas balearica]|uniref:DUF4214 domain-containing protein n=1 Tax=Stutzerimonas balearica TaxID=74829 RepID=UPI0022AFD016|nr:DUF4214 domain-containing protein [Stutzerimonas balearica]MCZ4128575.1 DUF4214 domain-containing protein [Stutzerimonas balearica]
MYIAYFGRPADTIGLQYWADKTEAQIIAGFSASSESQALFGNQGSAAKVNAIYNNLFARDAEPAGLQYWVQKLESGEVSQAEAMYTILNNAGAGDSTAVANKLAAAEAFTAQIDTTPEILGYSGANAAQSAREWLGKVNANASSLEAAKASAATAVAEAASASAGDSGKTFTLTTGVDNVTGTSGNDTIQGSDASGATALVLGGLDVIDGGAGTDTLKIADAATASTGNFSFNGATIKNVENIEVTTNGSFDVAANTGLSLTGYTGLTSATLKAAGTDNSLVLAADTTDVNLTVAGSATAGVTGGKAVSVTAGTGAVTVKGDALTSVTVKGGATTNAVTNTVSGTGSTGTTLTTVTFDGQVGSASGNALTNVNLKNLTSIGDVNVTNASTAPTLNLALDAVGYDASGSAVVVTVTDGSSVDNIKTVNVTTATKSNVELNTTAATAVTAAGAGALALDLDGTSNTAIASFDGSAATGNLTLSNLAAATATVKTGSGNDAFTVLATAKATVDAGAGNDTVTLNSALAAGSTVNLGAGNDTLLKGSSGSVAASTTTATTVIDGGDGTDTVAANFITVGNAAQFKNFEKLNLDSTAGLDLALLAANNTLTGLTMSTASTSATYQNVSKDFGLTVDYIGDNSSGTNTLQLKDATGTADAYTITFAADNSAATSAPTAANVQAGTIVTSGIETYNIVSGGSKAWNEITLGGNTSAQTVVITGAANLDIDFASGFGSTTSPATGVTLLDGSAANGKLDIDTTNVVAATAGLTVKGGSADDSITLAQKATVDAGAGDDTVIVSSEGGSITTGAGKDTVVVKDAVTGSATAPVITTVTDFTVGSDKLTFATQASDAFTATKIDVSTATALFGGTVNALDLAIAAADSTTDSQVTWFQYNSDTYVVQELGTNADTIGTDDIVVKLTGLVDLSTLTPADFNFA